MGRVSKQKVSREQMRIIQEQMSGIFLKLTYGNRGRIFLKQFFTQSEQIMFAKRLAVIAMLTTGTSYYEISKLLKVSTSTVSRLDDIIDNGAFSEVVKYVQNKKHRTYIQKCVTVLIFMSSPKMMTRERWKILDVLDE